MVGQVEEHEEHEEVEEVEECEEAEEVEVVLFKWLGCKFLLDSSQKCDPNCMCRLRYVRSVAISRESQSNHRSQTSSLVTRVTVREVPFYIRLSLYRRNWWDDF